MQYNLDTQEIGSKILIIRPHWVMLFWMDFLMTCKRELYLACFSFSIFSFVHVLVESRRGWISIWRYVGPGGEDINK